MRQYMRERQESRSTSTVAHMMAPVHVTVGTATGRVLLRNDSKMKFQKLTKQYASLTDEIKCCKKSHLFRNNR